MEEISYDKKTMAFAGFVSIAGAISMFIGAALWGASETDIWQTLATNKMETYLSQLPPVRRILVTSTCFWTLGVLLLGTALTLITGFCKSNRGLAHMALVFGRTGVSVAIVSFVTMISLAIVIPSTDVATLIGWIGARLDDIATMLIIGFSPLCLSIAGKGNWVPRWLLIWGFLAGIAGALGILSLMTGIVALGFIIIPFGLGWMIAAGVVLIKRSKMTTLATKN